MCQVNTFILLAKTFFIKPNTRMILKASTVIHSVKVYVVHATTKSFLDQHSLMQQHSYQINYCPMFLYLWPGTTFLSTDHCPLIFRVELGLG